MITLTQFIPGPYVVTRLSHKFGDLSMRPVPQPTPTRRALLAAAVSAPTAALAGSPDAEILTAGAAVVAAQRDLAALYEGEDDPSIAPVLAIEAQRSKGVAKLLTTPAHTLTGPQAKAAALAVLVADDGPREADDLLRDALVNDLLALRGQA